MDIKALRCAAYFILPFKTRSTAKSISRFEIRLGNLPAPSFHQESGSYERRETHKKGFPQLDTMSFHPSITPAPKINRFRWQKDHLIDIAIG